MATSYNRYGFKPYTNAPAPKPGTYQCSACGKSAECFLMHSEPVYTAYCRPCKAEHEPRPAYFR